MAPMKFVLLMALCVASASAQLPGMDMFGSMFKAASDVFSQTMNMGMGMVQTAFSMIPMKEAIAMSEAAMKAATDFPEQIMAIFSKAASTATSAAGGIANPGAQVFQMAAERVGKMKDAGAPKEEYMDLMQKMKEAMGQQR